MSGAILFMIHKYYLTGVNEARALTESDETHLFSNRHLVRIDPFLRVCAGRKGRGGRVCRWLLQQWLSVIQSSESNHGRTGWRFQTRQRSEQRYFRSKR